MKKQGIKELRNKILAVMREFPSARDSDTWLTIKIWILYYPNKIGEIKVIQPDGKEELKKFVFLNDILGLPKEDHVKRIRAKIQNEEHLYLPTTEEIRKQRKISEEEWKAWSTGTQPMF